MVQGVEHGVQKSGEIVPWPPQVSEFPGFVFQPAEHRADGPGPLLLLQKVSRQAVTEQGLDIGKNPDGAGAALLLAQP